MHLATRPTRDVPWLRVLDIPTASTRRTLSHILDAESLGKTSSQGYGPVPVGVWSQDSWTGSPRFGMQLHRGKGGGGEMGKLTTNEFRTEGVLWMCHRLETLELAQLSVSEEYLRAEQSAASTHPSIR
jgi:hypothetical protein